MANRILSVLLLSLLLALAACGGSGNETGTTVSGEDTTLDQAEETTAPDSEEDTTDTASES